ncbi:MAG: phage portal protein, partial [Clostridia bacterium]|nr:phage portal protein [Clostridia bacterium]
MDTIRSYITNVRGFNTVNAEYYSHIEEWNDWYKGYFAGFHSYTQYNGTKKVERKLYNLGMAKKVCEDHANLLMNEKVQISTGNDTFDEILEKILKDNNFHTRANQLVEVAYALGTGALVEYQNADGQPVIDYVRAQMIYPLAWDNGDITECAFASIRIIGGEEYYYINMHRLDDNKNYVIENK